MTQSGAEDRLPPQAVEIEKAIVGAMLIDGRAVDRAIELLGKDSFYERRHGHIFSAIVTLSESGKAVDQLTVGEQLTRLPLPNDAVLRTNALTGEVFLDGRPSSISIDIHQLSSDQRLRDNWIRTRMFPQDRIATFILNDATPLPDGFTDGDAVTFTVSGLLEIRGLSIPLVFEMEARDDGDVLFILGKTTFEWSDIGMEAPNNRVTISVDDEVRVEVLLRARPLLES